MIPLRPLLPLCALLVLAGCSTAPEVDPTSPTGAPLPEATPSFDSTYSRASNIGAIFQCPVIDVDPANAVLPSEAELKARDGWTRPFAGGDLLEADPEVIDAVRKAVSGDLSADALARYRFQYDQWWALVPTKDAPRAGAAALMAHREAVELTDRALDLAGYYTIPVTDSVITAQAEGGPQFVSVRRIINARAGCPETEDGSGCRYVVASSADTAVTPLRMPKWSGRNDNVWAVGFIPVIPAGKKKDGTRFVFPQDVREDIARQSSSDMYFFAAIKNGKPGFVGEKRQLRYAVMTADRLERRRRQDAEGGRRTFSDIWEETKSDIRDVFRSGF